MGLQGPGGRLPRGVRYDQPGHSMNQQALVVNL